MSGEEALAHIHSIPAEPPADQANGSIRARIANALVALTKETFGRGPIAAKAWLIEDDYILVVFEGGLARSEQTLLEADREDLVRSYRQAYQEAVADRACEIVEEIMGRRVAAHHCQIVFDPVRSFEFFVLARDEAS